MIKMMKLGNKALKVHPMCQLFNQLAPYPKKKYDELVADIAERGIVMPLLLNRARDTIIDGWNREKAAYDLKLKEFPYEIFKSDDDEEVRKEIISRNVRHRQLTADQNAAIVSKFRGPVLEKEAKERMQHKVNGDGKSGSFAKGPVVKQLAQEAGVSTHKMAQIEKVRKAGQLDDVITGKKKAKAVVKGITKKAKPRKEVTFEDQVYARWTRFLNGFAPPQRRRVMDMVSVWIGKK
jgi:hypothetical protein